MLDGAFAVEENGEGVFEVNAVFCRGLNTCVWVNFEISEEAVSADTECSVVCDGISNFIGSETIGFVISVDVVWILRLIEHSLAIVTIPYCHITEGVLYHESVSMYIVSIDNDSVSHWVVATVYQAIFIVVSTPKPGVVDDDVATVDDDHRVSFGWVRHLVVWSANSSEHI